MDTSITTIKPGRKASFNVGVFKDLLLERRDRVLADGRIAPRSAAIWIELSHLIDGAPVATTLWSYVKQNRHGLQDQLLETLSAPQSAPQSAPLPSDSTDPAESSDSSSIGSSGPNNTSFTVRLPSDVWTPWLKNAAYRRSEQQRPNLCQRSYTIFEGREWSSVIAEAIQSKGISCCWTFRRLKISPSGSKYLRTEANCKSCAAKLSGECIVAPSSNDDLVLEFEMRGPSKSGCNGGGKRHLSGNSRATLGRHLLSTNESASNWRRKRAAASMELGDPEPPKLFSADVLRKAKSEARSAERLGRCPIAALVGIKHGPATAGSILDVGLDPFFAHYWTPAQIAVYKAVSRTGNRTVCIDATGSIVVKLGKHRPHIFLYQMVSPGSDTRNQSHFPVAQMLSERHDTLSIAFWLSKWVSSVSVSPNVVVCDRSMALLGAVARSICGLPNLAAYMEQVWQHMTDSTRPPPPCLIRIDVAHLVKDVATFSSLRGKPPRVRKFYIRAIVRLIVAEDLDQAERILTAILIVAQSETEGEAEGVSAQSETQKRFLQNIIAEGGEALHTDVDPTDASPADEDCHLPEDFQHWLDGVFEESRRRVTEGDRDNAHYLPELVNNLKVLTRSLLLWSNMTGLPSTRSLPQRSTSASVESYFCNLKHRVMNNKPRLHCDEFVQLHLADIDGQLKLVAASSQSSTGKEKETGNILPEEVESQATENWRGQATAKPPAPKRTYFTAEPSWRTADLSQASGRVEVPLVSNANLYGGKPIRVRVGASRENVLLTNTCAFDGLLQLFAAACCDCPQFHRVCGTFPDNDILQLAMALSSGIRKRTLYTRRAEILRSIFPQEQLQGGITRVQCHGAVGPLVRLLLRSGPFAVTEQSRCSAGNDCPRGTQVTQFPCISATVDPGAIDQLAERLDEDFSQQQRPCLAAFADEGANGPNVLHDPTYSAHPLCNGIRVSEFEAGAFLLVEAHSIPYVVKGHQSVQYTEHGVEAVSSFPLSSIPPNVDFLGKAYFLRGAVAFIPPNTDAAIGHYLCYALRSDGLWERFNDVEDKPRIVSDSITTVISLLLYSE